MFGPITEAEKLREERDAALERVADLEASAAVLALVEQHMLLTGVLGSDSVEAE